DSTYILPDLIPYRKVDKWGFCDMEKKILIPPKYSEVRFFKEGRAAVRIGDVWGFINSKGEEVVPIIYKTHSYGSCYAPFIECYVKDFYEGLASVKKGNKYGYIDTMGNIVLPFIYASSSSFQNGRAVISLFNDFSEVRKIGMIDKNGNVIIPIIYDNLYNNFDFVEGIAKVRKNNKYGFVDTAGKEIVPAIYDDVSEFDNEVALAKMNGKWGVIDKINNIVLPCEYDEILIFNENGIIKARNQNVWKEFHDKIKVRIKDKNLKECDYHMNPFKSDGKWGFKNFEGNEIIKPKYENVSFFFNGLARVKLNNMYGFIDQSGKIVIPIIYEKATFFPGDYAWVKLNNKNGFIDRNGKALTSFIYDYTIWGNNGGCGIIFVVDTSYERPSDLDDLPCGNISKSHYSDFFNEGYSKINRDGKYGFINTKGKEVIPPKYNYVSNFHHGLAKVKYYKSEYHSEYGYIDINGTEYWEDE
ncbi:MAG: WG repeat-containing protein, partial [Ignavibacteria bacterium]